MSNKLQSSTRRGDPGAAERTDSNRLSSWKSRSAMVPSPGMQLWARSGAAPKQACEKGWNEAKLYHQRRDEVK